jgi:hypothetical protein
LISPVGRASFSTAWESQREPRPFALFALHREVALHRSRQVAAYRQSKPDAAGTLGQSLPQLDEGLEDGLVLRLCDASARVTYA